MDQLYVKYEKILYAVSPNEAEKVKSQKFGKIQIGRELLLAGKCEVIQGLPHNREDYEIRTMESMKLPIPIQEKDKPLTKDDKIRRSKYISDIKKELVKKLGW